MRPKTSITIRKAGPADADTIFVLIDALAEYEKLQPPDAAARKRLLRDMSGEKPRIEIFLAEVDTRPAGYAIILETYSSFLALPTLYLEDLFVLPSYRGKHVGYKLFVSMVAEAQRRGCGRMEWTVLDWNQIAIDFYRRVGATHMKEWHLYRLGQDDLQRLVQSGKENG